jgi:multicomponent Na+:H+ antiporter subunit A
VVALAAVLVGAVGAVFVALLVGLKPFVGARTHAADQWHAPGVLLIACPGVLAVLGLVWGIAPSAGANALVAGATSATHGGPAAVQLALWHGLTVALGLSVVAVAAGAAVYVWRHTARRPLEAVGGLADRIGPTAAYAGAVAGGLSGAERLTGWLQNDRLRWYSAVVLVVLAGAVAASLGRRMLIDPPGDPVPADIFGFAVLACLGGALAVLARRRIVSLVGLGMVGVAVVCLFAVLGAPDLAMTQISADALTIVLLLVAFRSLPDFRALSSRAAKVRDAVLATVVGGLMAVVTYLAATVQFSEPMSAYHSRASVPEGFGRNVVNVILVDFRALDTLGEITVVGMAALGVAALLGVKFNAASTAAKPEAAQDAQPAEAAVQGSGHARTEVRP